ncbi:MAG TPA: choice-of-anchor L domain-containing protein [Labilithrix sp.]|nr:choice-of-anchor L domain-containing protein [Labilithrix sp.]
MTTRTLRLPALTASFVGAIVAAACSGGRDSGFTEGRKEGVTDNSGTFGNGGTVGETAARPCVPNPANYDVPGNDCDDDGDGKVDNPPTCDADLSPNGDAADFAKSIGICTRASDKGHGLVSARFTRGYERSEEPREEQHGILPRFGNVIKPREGGALGVLSTGYAREYNGDGEEPFGGVTVGGGSRPTATFHGKDWYGYGPAGTGRPGSGSAPPGFPKPAAGCTQDDTVNDVVSIKLELKAPQNVSGVKFDFNFYSGEWPAYICSPFNDGFIAYLSAKGFNQGQPDNMSFDKDNNPVSVNNGFFDRCTPNVQTGCSTESEKQGSSACPGGVAELAGTGFGIDGAWCSPFPGGSKAKSTNGGATGWLTSQAPVQAGETFTIELMIWDTGDALLDSSVLIDNFSWIEGAVSASTDRPPK